MVPDARSFIIQNTHLQCPTLLPEIRLHLADDVMPVWERLQELTGDPDLPPPYWAFAWVGGIAVARYILDHRAEVVDRCVVDLGSGSGICSIAAGLAGASTVHPCETDPLAREALALNAEENRVALHVLDRDLLDGPIPDCDLILAGDMFYERALADRVGTWLRSAHDNGVRVIVGDPGRPYFPAAQMRALARYEIAVMPGLEDRAVKTARVHTYPDALS